MLCVVSGQTVVHWESVKARITTLPRNALSEIRWPNWFVSEKSGAAMPPSGDPGSRFGLAAACCADPAIGCCPLPPLAEPQPAAATAATASTRARLRAPDRIDDAA